MKGRADRDRQPGEESRYGWPPGDRADKPEDRPGEGACDPPSEDLGHVRGERFVPGNRVHAEVGGRRGNQHQHAGGGAPQNASCGTRPRGGRKPSCEHAERGPGPTRIEDQAGYSRDGIRVELRGKPVAERGCRTECHAEATNSECTTHWPCGRPVASRLKDCVLRHVGVVERRWLSGDSWRSSDRQGSYRPLTRPYARRGSRAATDSTTETSSGGEPRQSPDPEN